MHRGRIFTTIASVASLLIPFASAQFPGKTTVDNGEGGGSGADNLGVETGTREAAPAQTLITNSNSCDTPVQLLGLADTGPYMPVMIDDTGPYNFAISFEEEGSYIFSVSFCQNVLQIDGNYCYFAGRVTGGNDDDEKTSINTGRDIFEFEYVTLHTKARVGTDRNNIVLTNYSTRVVNSLDSDNIDAFRSRFGDGKAQGIIGLKNSGDFIQSLSSACNQSPGWGLHLQPNSFFSFGGIDSMASSIGSNDTSNVLDFKSSFTTAEIRPIISNFQSSPNNKFRTPVQLDTLATYNIVPRDIKSAVEGRFVAGATADIEISGTTFNIPWTSLVHADSIESDDILVLGTPFFEHVYAAMFPSSERQTIVFAPDNGSGQTQFTPFSEIESNLPTKTQPDLNRAPSSSGSPSPKADDGGAQPTADAESPAMVKSSNNIGAIVGGVVGGVVALLIILVAACCFYRRRKLMKPSPRALEKEYEADFDAEIGHHDGFFPQFKESGYATLPTPPPPPGVQDRAQIPSLILGSPLNVQYDSQTEYTPSLHSYHDESPSRSLNVTPLPPLAQIPILTIPPVPERRLSITPSLSIEPPSPLSRNVSAASRQNYPSIAQLQRSRSNVRAVPEEDDYDIVSMASGPTSRGIGESHQASMSAPRLPYTHRPDSSPAMGMTDRGAGL